MKIKTLLLLAILLSTSSFSWGQQFAMWMKVQNSSGRITFKNDPNNKAGHTDQTELLGYNFEVKSNRDAATGRATGKRQYQPITIWKASGASSPLFFSALTSNETISKINFEFYKPDETFTSSKGLLYLFYDVELINATVVGYKQIMNLPESLGIKNSVPGLYDEITLVFEKITQTSKSGNTTAADDWNKINQ